MFRRARFDNDLRDELRNHLAEREASYVRDGLSPEDARRRARLDFGNPEVVHEQSRDVWIVRVLDELRREAAIALRTLRRTPAFSLAAIATFALGIGAATAIFSVAYGIAFRPLPYREPGRLVRLYESNTKTNEPKHQVSQGTFQGWREGVPSLEDLALFSRNNRVAYLAWERPQPIRVMAVSPSFFDVLGISPLMGPGFKPEREYTRFTTNEFVLSHGAWQRLFGGAPDVVGRLFYIKEDDDPIRIVGVMPPAFAFDFPADAWRPDIVELPVGRLLRSWRYDNVIGRLREGRTIDQLGAELDVVSRALARDFPATNGGWSATAEPLRDALIGGFSGASWLFLAAVAAVLLAACANVAGLLTARGMARTRETSIRVALGAGRWRVARGWLVETCVLATAGAAAGVALAWWLVRLLRAAAPPGMPRAEDIAVDLPVLAAAAAATWTAAAVCALVPLAALRARALPGGLRVASTRVTDTPARRRVTSALVAMQCAAALALVALAVVFGRSFLNMTAVDLGWRPARMLSLHAAPSFPQSIRRPWYLYSQWADRIVDRLESTPGIEGAAVTTTVPFSGRNYPAAIASGRTAAPGETRWPVGLHMVTPGYFDMAGLSLVYGRLFTPDDRFDEATLTGGQRDREGVAIVTQNLARTLWPGENPLGKYFRVPGQTVAALVVVGVVADVRFSSITEPASFEVFRPWSQNPTGAPRLIVRAKEDAAAIAPLVRSILQDDDPQIGIDQVVAVDGLVDHATAPARVTRNLIAGLGLLALFLTAVGVFGALSMLVTARAQETALRIALGASPSMTLRRALASGLRPVAIGTLAGLAAAIAATTAVRSLLFGVERADGTALAISATLVVAVTALACLIPALRAARTDPLSVLRGD